MQNENIQELFTDQIDEPANAMRTELNRDGLFDLAENIKQNGLINPITVRPIGERFEVVAGHRRLSACKIAGKIKIPCVVRILTDAEVFEIMSAENLERADVDPVDEGIFLAKQMELSGKTSAEIAKQIRRSIAYVESRLAIGNMPDYMQAYLKEGKIKIGVALALIQITDENIRRSWVETAVRDGISVAQADFWVHGWEVNRLPGGSQSDEIPNGSPDNIPHVVKFRCFVDNREYDSRLFKAIMVYDDNLPLLAEICEKIRQLPPDTVSEPSA